MSENKYYFYLKIKENFFDSDDIKVLEYMDNGYKYSNILLKLYLRSLKYNGAVRLNEYIPCDSRMLAAITNHDVDTIKVALDIFSRLKLIEILDDGTIYMLNIQNYIGKSSTEADRIREYRKQIESEKKLIIGNSEDVQMYNKRTPEVELESELEKDISTPTTLKLEKDYIDFFNKNFYSITEYEKDILKNFEAEGINPEVITIALKQAVEANKKNMLYVKKILDRWAKNGIFTVDSVIADKKEFENKNNIRKRRKEPKESNFNNFQQREYDYDSLEKKLLGWDKI